MSALEDRIRAAYTAADTWGPVSPRPLALPRRRLAVRWVAPLTAAAALGVTVAGTMYAFDWRNPEISVPVTPPGARGPKPHFFVAGPTAGGGATYVADARTGRSIDKVPSPAGGPGYWQVAATGDNRNFILSTQQGRCEMVFYRLRLRDDGRVDRLARIAGLQIDGTATEHGMAVTSDGRKLAYTAQSCEPRSKGMLGSRVKVIDLSTGTRRYWFTEGHYVPSLSWTAGGRLVFSYYMTGEPQPPEESGVRVLDTTRPGTSLHKSSRELAPVPAHYSAISPDGQTIYAAVDGERSSRITISAYSARTGQKIRDLYVHSYGPREAMPGFKLLKLDGTGRRLLIVVDWKLMRIDVGGGSPAALPAQIKSALVQGGDMSWDAAW